MPIQFAETNEECTGEKIYSDIKVIKIANKRSCSMNADT